jgi:hypothetical protein
VISAEGAPTYRTFAPKNYNVAAFFVRSCLYEQERNNMKHIATAAVVFILGAAAVHAQTGPLTMTVSGTAAAGAFNLAPGATTSEYQLAGNSRLGQFELRTVSASSNSPQPTTSCSGPTKLSLSVVAGGGVFRFGDSGDLLTVLLTGGSDCIDLMAGQATCVRIFKVTGGTGRLDHAAGATLTLTTTVWPVLGDASNNPVFFAVTGAVTGAIPGVAVGRDTEGRQ